MQREVRAYVLDIVEARDAIAFAVHGLELDAYRTNRLIRSAVEREFITIGEAVAVLRQLAPVTTTLWLLITFDFQPWTLGLTAILWLGLVCIAALPPLRTRQDAPFS